jgi:hypothetical protein
LWAAPTTQKNKTSRSSKPFSAAKPPYLAQNITEVLMDKKVKNIHNQAKSMTEGYVTILQEFVTLL